MDEKFISKEIEGIKETNLKKLKQLFPSAFKDGQVDFEELKNQLGNFEGVEEEKYEFNWVGKQEAKQNALSNINGVTLKYYPEESKNADTTENLYIEGDNLKVLKLLRNNYANKIKMIYIDPPYNTGNDTFVYPDSFKKTDAESKEDVGITKDGERVINILKDNMYKNTKDSNKYHSAWLSMMYPRLKVAQELLSEDGVIFISIDDNEQENLKKMCNEIFGEDNFVVTLIRKVMEGGKSDTIGIATEHEYCHVYLKTKGDGIYKKKSVRLSHYNKKDEYFEERGYYYLKPLENGGLGYVKSLDYPILGPDGEEIFPGGSNGNNGYRWVWSQEKYERAKSTGMIEFINSSKDKSKYKVYYKIYEKIDTDGNPVIKELPFQSLYLDGYTNRQGVNELKSIFDKTRVFDYPKPISFLMELLSMSSRNNDIILDFFSGSAGLAHACMQLNSEDNGNRKFIMVQLPEVCDENSEAYKAGYKNICEIGKERIRRAGEKIRQETNANIDYGFKVFKLGETNINWEKEEYKRKIDDYILKNGFLDEKHKEELMKDFENGAKDIDIVYEILLRYYGMPLSAKIDKLDNIGHRTYSIGNVVIVCLEDTITNDTIDELSKIDFSKLYLRDSSFKGEKSLELKQNLMTRLNLQKNYNDEKVYKVEFI